MIGKPHQDIEFDNWGNLMKVDISENHRNGIQELFGSELDRISVWHHSLSEFELEDRGLLLLLR